tara:strand:+ start:192 stop:2192 length:2001 start_codon:yes stop_codon:yes gene_type:complete
MKKFRELTEQKETIVFAFGRFNPPTIGHGKLIQKTASVAGSSPYRIYPSFSQDPKKNPLPFATKVAYMKKMFKSHARNITVNRKAKTFLKVASLLHDEGFKNIIMVAGSDRVGEFQALLTKYNGVKSSHGFYEFDNIQVLSAGERDPDSEGVEGMSASKMRAAALDSDFDSFAKGVPFHDTSMKMSDIKKMYLDVRKNMGIREQRDMGNMDTHEALRDKYLTGEIWNVGDIIEANGIVGTIIRKGTNYVSFTDDTDKVHKAWLHEINEAPEDALSRVLRKIDAISHPARMKQAVKLYVQQRDLNPKKDGRHIAQKVSNMMGDKVRTNTLADYINTLIKKGKLPKNLAAQKKITKTKQEKEIEDMPGSQPAKYYAKGVGDKKDMAKSTKQARARQFAKQSKMDDDDPAAYKLAPGDKDAKTRPSQYTKKFKQMYGEESQLDEKIAGLVNKSDKTGVPYSILKKSYDRGMAAWKTGHRPGTTPQQWAFARVNSMLTGGKADPDLQKQAKKYKKKSKSEEVTENAPDTSDAMKRYKAGKAGFTDIAHLKAKGLIKRADGTKRKSPKYEMNEWGEIDEQAEYDGRKVKLNNPTRGDVKKYKVYVKNEKGKVIKIEFGDPNMEIKRDDPGRRKSFRARHRCDSDPAPKWTARYWSCKFWEKGKTVTDLMKG